MRSFMDESIDVAMIDHLSFYATDFAKTKAFYEKALAPLGYAVVVEMVAEWDPAWPTRRYCGFGLPHKPCLWIAEVKEADRATPRHCAFVARDRAAVDAFHAAALAAGGKDNGPPGPRAVYHPNYYGAFVFDPDGNNVEAVCHES
jgi:catechol 2,3-dioxygenase-like lactoylglutathione lyase family enzyme